MLHCGDEKGSDTKAGGSRHAARGLPTTFGTLPLAPSLWHPPFGTSLAPSTGSAACLLTVEEESVVGVPRRVLLGLEEGVEVPETEHSSQSRSPGADTERSAPNRVRLESRQREGSSKQRGEAQGQRGKCQQTESGTEAGRIDPSPT